MRRVVLTLLLCACATGRSSIETTNSTTKQAIIYNGPETGLLLAEHPRASAAMIASPSSMVWLASKKVFADWDIPLTTESPSTHQLGNVNFSKARQIAGKPMAKFVECGNGLNGPKAATYRIYISLLTDVIPDGPNGTKLQTTFAPMAQDVAGGGSDRIPCGSTGLLEQLFIESVKANLVKP